MSRINSMLPLAMSRANGLPIDISFDFPSYLLHNSSAWVDLPRVIAHACKTLVLNTKPEQWRSFVANPLSHTFVAAMRFGLGTENANMFKNLERLEVRYLDVHESASAVNECFGHLPNIRDVYIPNLYSSILHYIPRLRTLEIDSRNNMTYADTRDILVKAKSLTDLRLPKIVDSGSAGHIDLPTTLERLSLHNWPGLSGTQSLRVLAIHHLDYETAGLIASAAIDLNRISSLTLEDFPPMDRTILRILHNTPNIEELHLSGNVGDHFLRSLLPRTLETSDVLVPKLHTFSMSSYVTFHRSTFNDVIRVRCLDSLRCRCSVLRSVANIHAYPGPVVPAGHPILQDPVFILRELLYVCENQVRCLRMDIDRHNMVMKRDNENLTQLAHLICLIENIVSVNPGIHEKCMRHSVTFPRPHITEELYSPPNKDGFLLGLKIRSIVIKGRLFRDLEEYSKEILITVVNSSR
ncbi:hypothetical protein VNI00_009406 [Paramarasmius palmivorus]|uniref:F-box domain-containing protein n=1 Tax=Paramarasmius palmivorus TaxID=297713 RepID=A0AAW0B294_9AGAR